MSDLIAPDYPWKTVLVKGTSGGANNRIEYICDAEPGTPTSAAQWRIRKLVYDATAFNTQVLWASGNRKFDKTQTSYASYTYS